MVAVTAGFPLPVVAHSLLVVMWRSSHIRKSVLSLVSVVAAMASQPLQTMSPVSFLLLLKQQTQCRTELTSLASSLYPIFRHLWIYWTGGFHSKKLSNHSLPYYGRTKHLLLCSERTWLTGAPMILVDLDSVTAWWVRQETLPSVSYIYRERESEAVLLYQPLYFI